MAVQHPAEESGVEAMGIVLTSGDLSQIRALLEATNPRDVPVIKAVGNTHKNEGVPLLLPLVTAADRDTEIRRQAVRSLAETQEGSTELLQLARDNKLPNDVKFTAATLLNHVRWKELKAQAAQLLPLPRGRNTETLPPLSELLKQAPTSLMARPYSRERKPLA